MKLWLARFYLWLFGWKVTGDKPPYKKYVVLAVPHTSNWDVPVMLAMATVYGIRLSWIGKHTLFTGLKGPLMRWLGGIPVDRRVRQNIVQQIAEEYKRRDELYIAVPPEGTRGRAEYWKSGFYYIALEAGVPIVLGVLDFKKRVGGLSEVFFPTGDIKADMNYFRQFYQGASGKYPDNFGPIRLREEVEGAETTPPVDDPSAKAH